jgi:hypothetical protein
MDAVNHDDFSCIVVSCGVLPECQTLQVGLVTFTVHRARRYTHIHPQQLEPLN